VSRQRGPFRALTVRQPWAGLIVAGIKDVENRTWFSCDIVGRPLLIHSAGKFWTPLPDDVPRVDGDDVLSAIVGCVFVDDIIDCSRSEWAVPGMNHWMLSRAVRFVDPVPCVGAQNLWTPSDDVVSDCFDRIAAS
jgi:hypothetical protein